MALRSVSIDGHVVGIYFHIQNCIRNAFPYMQVHTEYIVACGQGSLSWPRQIELDLPTSHTWVGYTEQSIIILRVRCHVKQFGGIAFILICSVQLRLNKQAHGMFSHAYLRSARLQEMIASAILPQFIDLLDTLQPSVSILQGDEDYGIFQSCQ